MNDLRFAVRQLWKNPAFTAITVFMIALGVGANTAVFTVLNAVLLRPLPFSDPDHLVTVWQEYPRRGGIRETFSLPNFIDLRADRMVLVEAGAFSLSAHTLGGAAQPQRLDTIRVSARFLGTLGVRPLLGRDFRDEDDDGEAERVTLLSHHLWLAQFHGDPTVINRMIRLNEEAVRVIGVLPTSFRLGDENPDLLLPLRLSVAKVGRGQRGLTVIARVNPQVNAAQLSARLQLIAARLQAADPWANDALTLRAVPLHEQFAGSVRLPLLVLSAAVGCILLIACANVANLSLVRASKRQGELTIRAAMGASRSRIIRQLLVESLVLSGVGGAVGLLLGQLGIRLSQQLIGARLPQAAELALDYHVLGYVLATSVVTGILAGLFPALSASRLDIAASLQHAARGASASRSSERQRGLLVMVEVSLAFALLIMAGLLLRTLNRLHQVNLGFDANRILTVQTWLAGSRYNDNDAIRRTTVDEIRTRLASLPGVETVTFGNSMPLGDDMDLSGSAVDGRTFAANQYPLVHVRGVGANYFEALRVPLLEGRSLNAADNESAQKVVVINATMARRFWPEESPLGKRIKPDLFQDQDWRTIVGVIADFKNESVVQPPRPEVYFPYAQTPTRGLSMMLRTSVPPLTLAETVRREIWKVDSSLAIANPRTLEHMAVITFAATTFQTWLLGCSAGLAFLLALGGIYSVLSFAVASRTREIGIRIALGAQPRSVYWLIMERGARSVLLGIAVGAAISVLVVRFLSRLLFQISPTDPITFILGTLLLLLGAMAAGYLPARRAARIDPAVALRQE